MGVALGFGYNVDSTDYESQQFKFYTLTTNRDKSEKHACTLAIIDNKGMLRTLHMHC